MSIHEEAAAVGGPLTAAAAAPGGPLNSSGVFSAHPHLPMPSVIRVAVQNRPPLVYVQSSNGSSPSFDGFLVQMWRLLLDDANVSVPYTFWVPPVDVPGGKLVIARNGTQYWTGESFFLFLFFLVVGRLSRGARARRAKFKADPSLAQRRANIIFTLERKRYTITPPPRPNKTSAQTKPK